VTTIVRKAFALAAVLAGGFVASCAEATPVSEDAVTAIRERTGRRLEHAALIKPRMDQDVGLDPYLAPLLYLEQDGDPKPGRHAPGTVSSERSDRLSVDVSRPAIYFADTLVEVGGHTLRQLTYVWFRMVGDHRDASAQGLRITCDEAEQPALIEVLTDGSGARVVFVSERLEAQAAEAFGAAAPGRSYVVERPGKNSVVVAGTFGVGPVASGPIAYLAPDGVEVSQVHCRCEPSQVGAIDATIDYELLPLDVLTGIWPRSEVLPDAGGAFEPLDTAIASLRLPWGGD
jgi:subtilisin family serine protease